MFPPSRPEDCLLGGGEMGALMRAFDWSQTPLGPVAQWPQSLRTAVSMMLDTKFGMYIAWGPEFIQFYNDGYRPILGSTKHPAIGKSSTETFAEIWPLIGPMFEGVMRGEAVGFEDVMLPLDRHGFAEECYFIFSYSPIREEHGRVGGVLVPVTETTGRVLAQRRLATLGNLATTASTAERAGEAWSAAFEVLAANPADLPFALIYRLDGGCAHLVAARGVDAVPAAAPRELTPGTGDPWSLGSVIASATPLVIDDVRRRFGDLSGGAWPEPPHTALVLPIGRSGAERPYGVLIAGVSPRLVLDEAYREFLSMVAGHIGTGVANALAHEEERRRAEGLAEIDRAKTAFFSNVSHEFRTPLTLMLGPLQDALDRADPAGRGDLEVVQRNARRLLKLVNSLLDFSRIEAGRVRASYRPVDLAQLTVDLASSFRSAIERAGLRLTVDCPPLPEPLLVDRDLWEKIVLNLLSNAFKFTFEGEIAVRLAWTGGGARLTVADSGVGIAAAQLPHVFDRFHRVEGTRARTQEGSGIGLALVQELVRQHGGEVSVESRPGRGTTFALTIPAGWAHLPADQVGAAAEPAAIAPDAASFVDEALRWLPSDEPPPSPALEPAATTMTTSTVGRVLVADDNADMRNYLQRILSPHWTVHVVADGLAALAAARRLRPDIVLTDVMMPGLDGFALLRALRDDPDTRHIRLVMLSARAGEEARVEGLHAGADDYVVKPFPARELVARLEAQLLRARIESVEEELQRRLAQIFTQAPVGIALLRGPAHVFEFANAPYLDLVAGRNVVARPIRDALPELEGQGIFELLDAVYQSGRPYIGRSLPLTLQRGDAEPEERFFDFVYQPTMDDGRVDGIAVVVFEVTELAQARRAADVANRAKDEFLAMLGHELRNPLAPIFTALQLIRLRGVVGVEKECQVIERQVRHLMTLVDDLLDVARITRGKIALNRTRVELGEVLAKAVEFATPLLEQNRHELRVEVPRSGLAVDGDPERLAQVVGNLIANAAKYTNPGGQITVRGAAEGDRAVLSVQDSGIGIATEMLPHIFDLFVQEAQALDRSRGGLGLGLAIVKSLVQQHGGTVAAQSQGPGRGSTFVVTLPLAGAAPERSAAESARPAPAGRGGGKVLVVDDNSDAAAMLAEALRVSGYSVACAPDGVSALAQARVFAPDVALIDLGLPVMDGYELAAQMSREPGLRDIQLVAVTGYGQESDRERTAGAGFAAHFAKPVDLPSLLEAVDRAVTSTRRASLVRENPH